jgi:hypothetical protein
MKYYHFLFIGVLMFLSLSMWGCSQQKTTAMTARLHELESRYGKLDEESRVQQAKLEQQRQLLSQADARKAALEKQKADLDQKLQNSERERDELRQQVVLRTAERNNAHNRLMQLSKDLQALAGRVEAALNDIPAEGATIVPASRQTN